MAAQVVHSETCLVEFEDGRKARQYVNVLDNGYHDLTGITVYQRADGSCCENCYSRVSDLAAYVYDFAALGNTTWTVVPGSTTVVPGSTPEERAAAKQKRDAQELAEAKVRTAEDALRRAAEAESLPYATAIPAEEYLWWGDRSSYDLAKKAAACYSSRGLKSLPAKLRKVLTENRRYFEKLGQLT